MGEGHAYGYSLGCVSRRLFVLAVTVVMAALCYIQITKWVLSYTLWDVLFGRAASVAHPTDCTGTQCFEIISCFGLKDATQHVREPMVTVIGALLLPLGVSGAHHGSRWHLRVLAAVLAASALLHGGCVLADLAYMRNCSAYPTNMIKQTMTNWMPPSPVTLAAQAELRKMSAFPFEKVAAVTDDFMVPAWYFSLAGTLALFLAYVAREAHLLGDLAEYGPLGLGPHYGLDQWDQVLNHDGIRRMKNREVRSKFIDDAQLPVPGSDVESATPLSIFAPAGGYGAADAAAVPVLLLDRDDDSDEEAVFEAAAAAAAEEEEERALAESVEIADRAAAEAEAAEAEALAAVAAYESSLEQDATVEDQEEAAAAADAAFEAMAAEAMEAAEARRRGAMVQAGF